MSKPQNIRTSYVLLFPKINTALNPFPVYFLFTLMNQKLVLIH